MKKPELVSEEKLKTRWLMWCDPETCGCDDKHVDGSPRGACNSDQCWNTYLTAARAALEELAVVHIMEVPDNNGQCVFLWYSCHHPTVVKEGVGRPCPEGACPYMKEGTVLVRGVSSDNPTISEQERESQ